MTSTWAAMEWLFKIAQRAPFNIAPERGPELATEIFGSEKWAIERSDEPANFFAIPVDKAIYLTGAGQASLWCLAYVAFHVMDIASRCQRVVDYDKQPHIDISQYFAALHLGEYVAFSRALFHADLPWPNNLEVPTEAPPEDSVAGRINNIYLGALSWIFLHEIGHVHHGDQKFVPGSIRIRQEYLADDFATKWILDNAGNGLEREFRVLMITVALTWLFLNESETGQGTTHPAAILRFREAAEQFQAGKRSTGLENAAYLLKAVLDPGTVPPSHETSAEAFEWVSERLEALFPT
jgi:Peptidase U49